MNGVNVVITVKIFPTESVEKVQQAVQNLFPTVTEKFQSQQLESHLHIEVNGESGLTLIFARLREQRILAAARRVFRRGLAEKSVLFYLNKQAALANRISFCEPMDELSLGSIKVQIFCDDPEGIIDWLTLGTVST
ncbi:MAG: hypothetical protein JSV76_06440 [Candidatus Bathyarchaeota archaeon]|nr:MAG: hypothetical protein JSV76_06440 [Candidatus Bathyarchaeota archaeon]